MFCAVSRDYSDIHAQPGSIALLNLGCVLMSLAYVTTRCHSNHAGWNLTTMLSQLYPLLALGNPAPPVIFPGTAIPGPHRITGPVLIYDLLEHMKELVLWNNNCWVSLAWGKTGYLRGSSMRVQY